MAAVWCILKKYMFELRTNKKFLDRLKWDFNYLLNVFSDKLFSTLSTKTNKFAFCSNKVKDFRSILYKRDSFG